MNKSLFFLLSLIFLPCFGNQIHVLLDLKTTDNQIRQIMGSYNPETRKVTSFFAEADGAAGLFLAMEAAHLVDTSINDAHGQPVTIKKLDQEIPISTDAATFDLLQDIMAGKKDIANLDQPTTVKLLNTLGYTNAPAVLCDQLISHCADLFIAHPEQRCPFGTIDRGDNANDPSLYIQNAPLIEAARNNLYDRFKTHVLPLGPGWSPVTTLNHNSWVCGSVISPDGQYILTNRQDNCADLWNIQDHALVHSFQHFQSISSMSFSPDGQHVLIAGLDKHARIFDFNGNLVRDFNHPHAIEEATYSPDGQHVLSVCCDRRVYVWDISKGTILHTLEHTNQLALAMYVFEGQRIVTHCEKSNDVNLYDANGTRLNVLAHPNQVSWIGSSPNGQYILTVCDQNVNVWRADNGAFVRQLVNPSSCESAEYSPNGQFIITTCSDNNAYIWRTDGILLHTLAHAKHIEQVIASHDGRYIFTICEDDNTRVWDANGNLLNTFPNPGELPWITCLANGQQMLTERAYGAFQATAALPTEEGAPAGQQGICPLNLLQMAWLPQTTAVLELNEPELRRLAFMTRVALNPRLTAQEIINLRLIYRNLPRDQRVWVNRRTIHAFPGLFLRTLGSVYAAMKGIFKK